MNKEKILNTSISLNDIISLFVNNSEEIKSMELNSLLDFYIRFQETKVRPDTIIMYKQHIPGIISFLNSQGIYETKDINQGAIEKFVKYSISINNKNITINKRIGMLTAMLKRTSDLGLISMPAYNFKTLKEQDAKIEIIKKSDVQKILNQIDSMKLHHQVILYLLLSTGIRRNEVVNIKMNNINFKNKSIYLDYTKSGKPRYCYFGNKLEDLLKKLILKNNYDNPYLFQNGNTHINKQTISSMLLKLKKDLNIDVLSSHKFRHLYATQLLKNGADIFTVKQLLGHSKLENTQRYLDFTNEELKENNFKYNPLNNFIQKWYWTGSGPVSKIAFFSL